MDSIIDRRGRIIDYARISVTDRCNFRCVYCMPEEGVPPVSHGEIMRYEEIIWLSRVLTGLGVKHVRFTGGEPLARRGMPEFLLAFRREFPDIATSLTTNASLLAGAASVIADAGLAGVNISLDTLDSRKFTAITRTGDVTSVMSGIRSAIAIGLRPIKTNTVLVRGFNDLELPDIMNFAWGNGLLPRIIEFMPMNDCLWGRDKFVGSGEILGILSSLGDWSLAEQDEASHGPARYYIDNNTGRRLGIIEAVSNHFCSGCNRIRITASGKMRACLFNNEEIPLLHLIRERDAEAVKREIKSGINLKPDEWRNSSDGKSDMSGIGG